MSLNDPIQSDSQDSNLDVRDDARGEHEGDAIIAEIGSDAEMNAVGKDIHQEVHYHYGSDGDTSSRRTPGNMAPEPPAEFVDRPHEYDALKAFLLAGGEQPVAITAALRGAGGYGKTTLGPGALP